MGNGFSSGWGGGSCPTGNGNFSFFTASAGTTLRSNDLIPNGTGNQFWRFGIDWGGTTAQRTQTIGSDVTVTPNTKYTLNSSCTTSGSIRYNVSSTLNRYVFKTLDGGTNPTGTWVFFEIGGTIRTFSSHTAPSSPTPGLSRRLTVTMSGTFNAGQSAYIRYHTGAGFSSATISELNYSGSGNDYFVDIPASVNAAGTTITYYFFTSGNGLTISNTDADLFSINVLNNSGSNYNYTVSSSGWTAQSAGGNWSNGSTWNTGVAPPTNINLGTVTINQNTVVDQSAIVTGLTFAASRTLTINSGVTLTTTGAWSSASTNPIAINGTLAVGGGTFSNTAINTVSSTGNVQINTGGFISGGTFTYNSGATLTFNASTAYAVNNTDIFWPVTNGPTNVSVLQGGLTLNSASRTVSGTFSTAATVTLTSSTLTLSGTCQINAGGGFANSPTYSGTSSTLVYNTGTAFNTSNEWNGGGSTSPTIGTGVPGNVIIQNSGTSVTLTGARGTPGNVTISTGAVLNLGGSSGQDLYLAGNFLQNGGSGGLINNGRAVYFVGSATQIISASGGTAFFDFLIINKSGGSVQLSNISPATDITINTTTGNFLQLLGTGSLDLNGRRLNLNNNGGLIYVDGSRSITSTATGASIEVNGNKFIGNNGGVGSLSIGANVTVNINANGQLDFGRSGSTYITTLNGTLSINSSTNCFVRDNPPIYASGSILHYNTGGTYGRGREWFVTGSTPTTPTAGYPFHVILSKALTELDISNSGDATNRWANGTAAYAAGNLTVNSGAAILLTNMKGTQFTPRVVFGGDVFVNNGGFVTFAGLINGFLGCVNYFNYEGATTTLTDFDAPSGNVGADIRVTGNFSSPGAFNCNKRAIFFTGSASNQTVSSTTPFINYVVVDKSAGKVTMLGNLIIDGINGNSNALVLSSTTSILDINGNKLTLGATGVNSTISGSGYIRGSTSSKLEILGTGAFGTINFDPSSDGTTNVLDDFTINRTSTGTVTLGTRLHISGFIRPNNGSLVLGNNDLVLQSRTIANTGKLAKIPQTITSTIPFNFSGTGRIIAERFTNSTRRGYRNLTSNGIMGEGTLPDGSIWANWQESATSTNYNPNPGFGTHITGDAGNGWNLSVNDATGIDYTYTGNPSLWTYTTGDAWQKVTNTKTKRLFPFEGYYIIIRGNRAHNLNGQPGGDLVVNNSTTVLRNRGLLVYGNVTLRSDADPVYSVIGGSAVTSSFRLNKFNSTSANWGYSLVGNPYACTIDWGTVYSRSVALRPNLSASYTFWMQTAGANEGSWVTVDNNGISSNPGANRYIQPGQAFFIKTLNQAAQAGEVTLSFTSDDMYDTDGTNLTSVFDNNEQKTKSLNILKSNLRRLDSTSFVHVDGAVTVTQEGGNNGFDGKDAQK
ncbi:MAG: beta strand repeat-containing protein, partial [Chitinophagaceae bacterium]